MSAKYRPEKVENMEDKLIARLARRVPAVSGGSGTAPSTEVRLGIGDDAAILRQSSKEWVVSCDSSLEGVHFRDGSHPPESIGYKSLARAVSDLAAMGSRPRYFLLALALPATKTDRWLDRFASGMAKAARELGIRLIGGDTSKSQNVMISITVLGEIAPGQEITRSGARPGDLIYVSGQLGRAQLGLELILGGLARRRSLQRYLQPHLYPKIPLALAQSLATRRIATAMMDISDGLSTDLARLCAASGVGARIWSAKIPKVQIPVALARENLDALELALHGGEDYGLLFTIRPQFANRLRHLPSKIPVTCIGEITRARKIILVSPNSVETPLPARGWDPFRE
ncbi:MAG TPA: thiamine-phosphate kinase [Candidatus Acidoferrales bacterium]|nr:thiamine-phosphate kinase [Candidatus Acidoferrales bacterium]